jgi:multimeric flavodoxin WrbA
MQKVYPLLLKADAIVFATPVYWFNMSGQMKTFIDRLCCMAAGGYRLEGKIGVFYAVSKENEGGKMSAALAMASAMNHLGLMIPPYGTLVYPGKEKIVKNGKTVWDDWIFEDAPKIAKNIVSLCKFLKKSKFKW